MNELSNFNFLNINFETQTISARELYKELEVKYDFKRWVDSNFKLFVENKDYFGGHIDVKGNQYGGTITILDYDLTINMAEHLCLLSHTEKGMECRQRLIDLQEMWNTPEFVMARAVKMADAKIAKLSGEITTLNNRIEEMKPKVDYCAKILESTNTMLVTQIAQDYGMSAITFNKLLHELGIQRKVNGQWILYEPYLSKKYTKSHTHSYERTDGSKGSRPNTEWTQEGRKFLYHFLKKHNILPLIEREG